MTIKQYPMVGLGGLVVWLWLCSARAELSNRFVSNPQHSTNPCKDEAAGSKTKSVIRSVGKPVQCVRLCSIHEHSAIQEPPTVASAGIQGGKGIDLDTNFR
ncbi:hypothetical protein DFH06DRAFT_1147362 [Mycena polygramma]|nr:hypothetical protein DFH06DRAFT_1147362 [Mycena polygramma]